MKKIAFLLVAQLIFSGAFLNAQKVVLKSGSFDFLKGQKTILVKYDYSNIAVGKYEKEDEYVAQKVEDYNKSEAGKGDSWKESWFNDRPSRFEPKFELLFNNNMAEHNMTCNKDTKDAKYEMLVHTTFVEPGFNVGVMRKNAYIDATITFRETGTDKSLAEVTIENCPGRDVFGYDFDTGLRIEEAYAKLGKSLAALIDKKL
jgi:hypothetical protein